MIQTRFAQVDGHKVFYREGGNPGNPAILLLHGFPTSSHMFRNLMPRLAGSYHLIAPDLPGFGFSDAPPRESFPYTFDNLASVIDKFTEVIGLKRYAIYVFDYGAPIGWRLATAHPQRVSAIISQNGNAYEEGLSAGWNPIQKYWQNPTRQNRDALRDFLKPEATQWQYAHGVADPTQIAPESYTLDSALLARPGNDQIQLDLFLDYQNPIPGVAPISRAASPAVAGGVGKKRPVLPAGRSGTIPAGQSKRAGEVLRHGPLCAGNPRRADRRRHPEVHGRHKSAVKTERH